MDMIEQLDAAELEAKRRYKHLINTNIQKYQFQSLNYLDALSHETLYMSDPTKFNDPFDLKIEIVDDTYLGPFGSVEKLRNAFRVLLESTADIGDHWFYDDSLLDVLRKWTDGTTRSQNVISTVGDRLRKFGVACFAPEWDMPLMWSHYGDSHKGLCVEYLVQPATLSAEGDFFPLSVTYASELPSICLSEALFSPHKVLPRLLATKHVDWAYEKEWRLIHLETKGSRTATDGKITIGSLIVGRNASC